MALEVDGSVILQAIAKAPEKFGMTTSQVNTLALNAVLGRLKDKAIGIEAVSSIASAMNRSELSLVLDSLSVRELAALSKRLDPRNPEVKTAEEKWHREHITQLAYKDVLPAAAAERAVRARAVKPAATSKAGEVMASKALKPRAPKKTTAATGADAAPKRTVRKKATQV